MKMKKVILKLEGLKGDLNHAVKGREEMVEGLILALASQEHILVKGEHGEAKSMIVKLLCDATELKYCYRQIHNETTVKDIVGILNPIAYRKGEIELLKTEFWDAHILFLDEFLRGRSEFLDFMMEVMQERKCSKTLLGEQPVAVLSTIATTNPLSEEYNTERLDLALQDRFAIILNIEHLIRDNPDAVREVLDSENGKVTKINLNVGELRGIRENSKQIPHDSGIIMAIFTRLKEEGFIFSTRFTKQYRDICKVRACLHSHKRVEDEDYFHVGLLMLNNRFDGLCRLTVTQVLDDCIMSQEYKELIMNIGEMDTLDGETLIQEGVEIINKYGAGYAEFPKLLQGRYDDLLDRIDEEMAVCLDSLSPNMMQTLDVEKLKHHIKDYVEQHTKKTKRLVKVDYEKALKVAEKVCANCIIEQETFNDRMKLTIKPDIDKPMSFSEIKRFESICSERNIKLDIYV